MEALRDLFALMFVVALHVLLSLGVMVYGYGVQPRSWWWIIGGGVIGITALRWLSDKLVESDKK